MSTEFTPVKVRSPQGDVATAHTPTELNNLIFGHGYTVVGNKTVADVIPTGTPAPDAASTGKKETSGG